MGSKKPKRLKKSKIVSLLLLLNFLLRPKEKVVEMLALLVMRAMRALNPPPLLIAK